MELSIAIKLKIFKLIFLFENATTEPSPASLTILPDGPRDTMQITYGKLQTTEMGGGLKKLLDIYAEMNGQYSNAFKPFLPKLGKKALVENKKFICLLKEAGKDSIMDAAQDVFFEQQYFQPAYFWAQRNGFTEPLSMAVIFDSFIHSGGVMSFLRKQFTEKTPVNGGNERLWIKHYLETRHDWLIKHRRNILRNTIYRTTTLLNAVSSENWDFEQPIKVVRINKILQ